MKRKRLFTGICILILFAGCSKENLPGGKLSRVYAGGVVQSEYFYNTEGALTSQTVYGMPGRKTSEQILHYDGNGKPIKKESAFDLSSGPTPQWSYSYTDYIYNADGKISEEMNYLKQGGSFVLTSKVTPVYDGNGKLVSRKLFLPNGSLIRQTTYEYSTSGNIILQEEYRYTNSIAGIEYRYKYDAFDNMRNPYIGLPSGVPPYSININNILQTTVTNFVITPGTPVTAVNNSVYQSYNNKGLPVKVTENGTSFMYEYY